MPDHMTMRRKFAFDTSLPFHTTATIADYKKLYEKFKTILKERTKNKKTSNPRNLFVTK